MTRIEIVTKLKRGKRISSTPNKASRPEPIPHPADDLSFMKRRKPRGAGIDYWLISPTGAYGEDCEIGKKLAAEYLPYVGEHPTYGNGILLTCIVREMIDRAKTGQEWSGIHVGFLRNVNCYAMVSARAETVSRGIEARVAKAEP